VGIHRWNPATPKAVRSRGERLQALCPSLEVNCRFSHRMAGAKEGVKDLMFNEAPQLGTHGTMNV